jgi:dihydroneopterin aldolase
MTTYTITLQNCAFFARHGVHDEEVVAGEALESDSINDTVNYGIAFTVIEQIVTGKRRYLIEALALDIAKGLCETFPQIRRAKITVRKPNAPVPGVLDFVQVSVEHFA